MVGVIMAPGVARGVIPHGGLAHLAIDRGAVAQQSRRPLHCGLVTSSCARLNTREHMSAPTIGAQITMQPKSYLLPAKHHAETF